MPHPCPKHPQAPRYISGRTKRCLECGRENARRWAQANKERHLENSKRHHKEKKSKVALRKHAYYTANPDKAARYKETTRQAVCRKWRGAAVYDPPKWGMCPICNYERLLVYDHDHKTDAFRGWICNNCNFGLGHFKDSPEILHKAADYLRRK